MLGCEVPPWRTITFGGGQGLGVPVAGVDCEDPASETGCFGVVPEAEAAGSERVSQLPGTAFFLCAVFFPVEVCDFLPCGVFAGGVLVTGADGVSEFVEGFEPL